MNPIQVVRGVIIVVAATFLSAAVAAYLWFVFWTGTPPNYELQVGGKIIPPEVYPIVLLALWSTFQRLQTRLRPSGAFFKWTDALFSFGLSAFIATTIFKVVMVANPNPTFLPVLGAFLIAALVDLFLNSERRFGNGVGTGWGLRGIRREDLVTGTHGDLPDRTEELASRSGSPLYRATGDAVIELNWWARHPVTGELIPVKNVPPRLSIRAIEHIASEPMPSTTTPPPAS